MQAFAEIKDGHAFLSSIFSPVFCLTLFNLGFNNVCVCVVLCESAGVFMGGLAGDERRYSY